MRYSAVTCLSLAATTDRRNLTAKTKKNAVYCGWGLEQLCFGDVLHSCACTQHVSNECMTAHSYQMSSIRSESWENLPRGFKNCSTRSQFACMMDHKLHTNVHMRDFKEIRYHIFLVKSESDRQFNFFPPTIEDSHSILLVSWSTGMKTQKYTINCIFERLKYELLRALALHNLDA